MFFYLKIKQSIKWVSVITLCLLIGALADKSCGKSSDIINIWGLEGAWKNMQCGYVLSQTYITSNLNYIIYTKYTEQFDI